MNCGRCSTKKILKSDTRGISQKIARHYKKIQKELSEILEEDFSIFGGTLTFSGKDSKK